MKRKSINIRKKQDGYIVIMTIILLTVLLTTSISFFQRSANNMQMTGYNRDSAESLLLAESAMNSLMGRYMTQDIDLDNPGVPDMSENITNVAAPPIPYIYYIAAAGVIAQNPAILQRVANGEAQNISNPLVSNMVPAGVNNLSIGDLFAPGAARPIVFTFAANNLLQPEPVADSTAWDNAVLNNNQIAAAWFEAVQDPNIIGSLQVYIQSVAIVGNSKSYVQRLFGYIDTTVGSLSTLNQN